MSEIILIDDGSIDETPKLLPQHIAATPAWRERVKYFHQENQGQAAACNNGIARARGEWLAFNSNDDLWLPQKLEWEFRALDQYQGLCQACFTDAWFMNNPHMKTTLFQFTGRKHTEAIGLISDTPQYLMELDPLCGVHPVWVQTMVVKTETVRRVGGFDAGLRYGEDDDFVFRLACETNFCFVGMPMVLIDRTPAPERHVGAARNWHKQSFLLQMNQRRFEKRLAMSQRLSPGVQRATRKSLSGVYSSWVNWYLQQGEYAKANEAASKAIKYYSSPNLLLKWLLTRVTPGLTRRAIVLRANRQQRRAHGIT